MIQSRVTLTLLALVGVVAFAVSAVPATGIYAAGDTCAFPYIVSNGDSLPQIAARLLGDVNASSQIINATNAQNGADGFTTIADPDKIEIDQKLCIPEAPNAPAGLELSVLANAAYTSDLGENGTVTLKDAVWQQPVGDGSPALEMMVMEEVAYGKIGGTDSAAVVTWDSGGGTARFYNLHLMQLQDGALKEIATLQIGDRVFIHTIKIADDQIVIDMVQQVPGDGDCCPSDHVINTYAFDGGALELVSTMPAENSATGPMSIVGQVGSANATVSEALFPEPSVALVDASNLITNKPEVFVPDSAQILGTLTTPLFPLPGKFSINLPIVPAAASVDLDNNGTADKGVQIFYMLVSSNIIGDSYLQQLEQYGGLGSFIQDTASGEITQGSFLVYAPDNAQKFPSAIGADGKWFTADDPTAPLEGGYTVATLGADGKVTLDRSNPGTINSIERAEAASPDFSKQGILESFNSLIDHLKKRYAYTELRKLDWEKIRAQYLPTVQKADAEQDMTAYYGVLEEIAHSLLDAHVSVTTTNAEAQIAALKKKLVTFAGNVGASVIVVTGTDDPKLTLDSKIIVRDVADNSPAKQAGWVPGTEIVSINSKTPAERYAEIPLIKSVGTQDALIFQKSERLLNFPISQTVTIGYRLPDTSEVMTTTMTAGEYPMAPAASQKGFEPPISFTKAGDFVVIRWTDFIGNILPKIQTLEMALSSASGAPGVILDLRGNTGGWVELMETMASYFFTAENPYSTNLTDFYDYDAETGKLVRRYAVDYQLSAPDPTLAYTGPVVILVDSSCASACEYFSQHMQQMGRAKIVGQYTTEGAGGPVDRIKLPGATTFQYTVGKTTFAGTDELNLEAKGVTLDLRVPVTLETELAKQNGGDPVMDAAVAELTRASDPQTRLSANPWQWTALLDANGQPHTIEAPSEYTVTFGTDGTVNVQADCNQAGGTYSVNKDGEMTITLGPATLAECPAGSKSAEFLQYLAAAKGYGFEGHTIAILLSSDSGALGIVFEPAK